MLIARGALLARLNEARVGISTKEQIEQSNCFVFKGDKLITFNDTIMVRAPSPLDFDCIVNATDLLTLLGRIPDDEIDIAVKSGEVRIKGKRRTAGIACLVDVLLPIDAVPEPEKWHRLADDVPGLLQQAQRICSTDDSLYLTTVVHIGPEFIESCDRFRLFRATGATGFPAEALIAGTSLAALEGLELSKVAIGTGWVHFKTSSGSQISIRCGEGKYHEDMDRVLEMHDPESLVLPSNLGEILERAEVFNISGDDARVGIRIAEGQLSLTARKDGGWYKERKRVEYTGKPLDFSVHPKFLAEMLKRKREVVVDEHKIKITSGSIEVVVCLDSKSEDEE